MPSEPRDLEAILTQRLKTCASLGVRLHDSECTSSDCIDPFLDYHEGRLPMSLQDLALCINSKTNKEFTSDHLFGFFLGFEDDSLIDTADPEFYKLGQKLRQLYIKWGRVSRAD
jgi:hypothetical protein